MPAYIKRDTQETQAVILTEPVTDSHALLKPLATDLGR